MPDFQRSVSVSVAVKP